MYSVPKRKKNRILLSLFLNFILVQLDGDLSNLR
jgi:hypothetical protein